MYITDAQNLSVKFNLLKEKKGLAQQRGTMTVEVNRGHKKYLKSRISQCTLLLASHLLSQIKQMRLRILKCKNKFSILTVLSPTFHCENIILRILLSYSQEICYECIATDGSSRSDVIHTFLYQCWIKF